MTIILFSRVCYDQEELQHVSGPLNHDKDFGSYKDFVSLVLETRVLTDHAVGTDPVFPRAVLSSTKSASTWRVI